MLPKELNGIRFWMFSHPNSKPKFTVYKFIERTKDGFFVFENFRKKENRLSLFLEEINIYLKPFLIVNEEAKCQSSATTAKNVI